MYNKFFKEKILAAALTLANGWKPARWIFLNPLTGIRSWGFYEGDDIRIELGSLNIGVQKSISQSQALELTRLTFSMDRRSLSSTSAQPPVFPGVLTTTQKLKA